MVNVNCVVEYRIEHFLVAFSFFFSFNAQPYLDITHLNKTQEKLVRLIFRNGNNSSTDFITLAHWHKFTDYRLPV